MMLPTWRRPGVLGRAVFLPIPLALLLGSCGTDASTTETVTGAPATAAGKPAAVAGAPAQSAPLPVHVFLELSGGMKGFMPVNTAASPPTAFQQRVSQLASRTNSSPLVPEARFWLSLNGKNVATPYADFRNVVQGQTRQAALGTELPTMLENMLAQPGADQRVNVIVSDFIYGPKDPATTALMDVRVTDALALVNKKQLAVAVLAETSRFFGTFHPAVKKPLPRLQLKGEERPYYIWVVGPPAAVGSYVNALLPATPQTRQAYFGLRFPRVPYAAVLSQVPPTSPLLPTSEGSGSLSFAGAQPSPNLVVDAPTDGVDFSVALDLRQLPAAWREPAYLQQQLRVALPGGAVQLLPGSVKRLSGVTGLDRYTHVLRLRLRGLPAGGARLSLTLPAPGVPAWVAQWSTENDNQPGPRPQTYRLTQILSGVQGAFAQPQPPVFRATFQLTQD